MDSNCTAIRLKKVPLSEPTVDHWMFDAEYSIPTASQLKANQMLVRALWISVDPYLRGRLYKTAPNTVIKSGQIAQVVKSNIADYHEGDIITGNFPWSEYSVITDGDSTTAPKKVVPAKQITAKMDLSQHLGPLGLIGITAYQGLFDIGKLKKGETVFVSGAAGGVGSMVGQIAKHVMGCKVFGVAGSDDKCAWLKQLGFDGTINYKKYDSSIDAFQADLKKMIPDGIDLYFDNVGGFITESVWDLLNFRGRVILCGQISNYNKILETPKINDFLYKLVYKHVRVGGFAVVSFRRYEDFDKDMNEWLKEGKIQSRNTIKYGFHQIPKAFLGLFKGENTGKMLVKIADAEIASVLPEEVEYKNNLEQ